MNNDIARSIDTSDRRLAVLAANGEDKRNTPAWRDAVHESRMVRLYARLHGVAA